MSLVNRQINDSDGYSRIIEKTQASGGIFSDWARLAMPDGPAVRYLSYGVEILCVHPRHKFGEIFLAWSIECASAALNDGRFNLDPDAERCNDGYDSKKSRGWRIKGIYPGNHGKTLAAACFARALRDNSELDTSALRQAGDDIVISSLHGGSSTWDYIAQSEYLRCVRLALTAGDVAHAQFLLKNVRRKFKHTFVHQEWLQELANGISAANGASLPQDLIQNFEAFFDRVRQPQARLPSNQPGGVNLSGNLSLLRLELALIKQRYVVRQPLAGNWNSILGFISA